MIHSWFYGGEDNPRNEEPRVHMNYWCIEEPPSDRQEHEVIVAEFKFIPWPPREGEVEIPKGAWWKFWE